MRLNKIEKIVIAVLIAAGILAAGIVMFALPAYQGIEKNNKALAAAQKELDDINTTLVRKDTIDGEIKEIRESAEKLEGGFYPDLTPYEADEIVQAYLRDNNIKIRGIDLSTFATTDLKVTAYNTTIVSYQLKEYSQAASTLDATDAAVSTQDVIVEYDADGNVLSVNGASITSVDKKIRDLIVRTKLLQLTTASQTVGITTVGLDAVCEYGDYLKFVDYVADLERATYLPEIEFLMTATEGQAADNQAEGAAPAAETKADRKEVKDTDIYEFTGLTLLLYSVEPMGVNELETIEVAGTQIVVNQ